MFDRVTEYASSHNIKSQLGKAEENCTICFLRIWSYLRKKSLMENSIFCAVQLQNLALARVQMLLMACQRFVLMRTSEDGSVQDLTHFCGSTISQSNSLSYQK